jgi:hypothetical protein
VTSQPTYSFGRIEAARLGPFLFWQWFRALAFGLVSHNTGPASGGLPSPASWPGAVAAVLHQNLLFICEPTWDLDAPTRAVPEDAGACRIGSGVRTIMNCLAPSERFGAATPATPPWEVPRPPPPASAAEATARVAMIKNAIFRNLMAKASYFRPRPQRWLAWRGGKLKADLHFQSWGRASGKYPLVQVHGHEDPHKRSMVRSAGLGHRETQRCDQ